jgi:hypothetical protein
MNTILYFVSKWWWPFFFMNICRFLPHNTCSRSWSTPMMCYVFDMTQWSSVYFPGIVCILSSFSNLIQIWNFRFESEFFWISDLRVYPQGEISCIHTYIHTYIEVLTWITQKKVFLCNSSQYLFWHIQHIHTRIHRTLHLVYKA